MTKKLNYVSSKEAELYLKLINKIRVETDSNFLIYNNGYVLPNLASSRTYKNFGMGGVCDCEGNFINDSTISTFGAFYANVGNILFINDDVTYCGLLHLHYGHLIADVLPYIIRASKIKNRKLCFVSDPYAIKSNSNFKKIKDILNAFGIDENSIYIVNETTRFKSIAVFNNMDDLDSFLITPYYEESRNILIRHSENLPINNLKRFNNILLSRRNCDSTISRNILKIEKFLEKRGFQILCPESMSLFEQIRIINSAKNIVCYDGTLAHSAVLFANKNANIIILKKRSYFLNRQFPIDYISNSNIYYVKCYINYSWLKKGYILPYITKEFKKFYKDFFDIRILYFFPSWLYLFLRKIKHTFFKIEKKL